MALRSQSLFLIPLLVTGNILDQPSEALTGLNKSPIQKVVVLLKEMKEQTYKEGDQDLQAYDKYMCWCQTTEAEKTAAIKAAEQKIAELNSFIEEAAAKEGELKTEIAGLEEDIAADQDALQSATAMRAKENDEFKAEEADLKETLDLLSQAITVLQKVQLVQKGSAEEHQALVQVGEIVKHINPKFGNVMQKDLYDILGGFQNMEQQNLKPDQRVALATGSILGEVFLPKREAAALAQSKDLPWIKTEEQLAMEAKPTDEVGAAAGAKSYNARSGSILGLLKQMGDEMAKELAAAQKGEMESLLSFQRLAAAKTAEIAAANRQKTAKETELADTMDKAAKAKEDLEATENTLTADQKFLMEATKSCKEEDELYQKRVAVRSQEIKALGETLDILTGDDARSLFDKTISFLQLDSVVTAQEAAKNKAFQRILAVSKKHKNWMLASLAVHVKLDAFTKVKEAMDKMLAELKAQQKNDYDKHELCKKDIDATEDKIKVKDIEKRDLAAKHQDVENTINVLQKGIEDLTAETAEAEVSLKEAGENRKTENHNFQTAMADQRATIHILTMALDRLKVFYAPKAKAALVQVHSHADPPPRPSGPESVGYTANEGSGGVMQMIQMIIEDAERTETEMHASEQASQQDYASYVAANTASIEANREAIAEKEKQKASAESEKSETQESQLANQGELDKLAELLTGMHSQCDYLIKYFDVRQTARQEEMDAIAEAKAILSGADFGK